LDKQKYIIKSLAGYDFGFFNTLRIIINKIIQTGIGEGIEIDMELLSDHHEIRVKG
jgi:hypothetical protein